MRRSPRFVRTGAGRGCFSTQFFSYGSVLQMRAAVFLAVFALAAAIRADSEPDLTIVTSEIGSDDAVNSAQSDFSRRIGKQFPVAENSVNTRGSGGARQKATNLVSGRKSNEKEPARTDRSKGRERRREQELFYRVIA